MEKIKNINPGGYPWNMRGPRKIKEHMFGSIFFNIALTLFLIVFLWGEIILWPCMAYFFMWLISDIIILQDYIENDDN